MAVAGLRIIRYRVFEYYSTGLAASTRKLNVSWQRSFRRSHWERKSHRNYQWRRSLYSITSLIATMPTVFGRKGNNYTERNHRLYELRLITKNILHNKCYIDDAMHNPASPAYFRLAAVIKPRSKFRFHRFRNVKGLEASALSFGAN